MPESNYSSQVCQLMLTGNGGVMPLGNNIVFHLHLITIFLKQVYYSLRGSCLKYT